MTFNGKVPNNKKTKKGHVIEEYKVKDDYIRCRCGFETNPDNFKVHYKEATGRNPHHGTLSLLDETAKARSEYPINGTLTFGGIR